jgi:phasin family protein
MHKKPLDFGLSRPYNWFCAVQQNGWPGEGSEPQDSRIGQHPTICRQPVAHGDQTQPSTKGNTMNATMYAPTEQIANLSKANIAQATKLAALALENAEKLVKLNMSAAKVVLAQGVEGASAAASVKDVQDLFALRAKYAESGVEAATAYTRGLYEISSEAQAQFTAFAEEAWSTYTKDVAGWVEKASKSAPAGSEAAVNAFKSTIAASTAAFDQFQKATKQVVSLADASVRAASANATKAATKARKAA